MSSVNKQKLFLDYLCSSQEVFTKINPILETNYFDPELRKPIQFVKAYYEAYKESPTREMILAETDTIINHVEINRGVVAYALDELEGFCKRKAIEKAIRAAPLLMQEEKYGELEANIKNAITISLNRKLGTDYFDNPEERLRSLLMNYKPMSTGWREVDEALEGGPNRKELLLFAAGSGVGKSVTMSNLAVNLLSQRYNVVYISLELSEESVSKRFDSMIAGFAPSEIFKNIKKVAYEVEKKRESMGKLDIIRMPENSTTTAHVRSYLKEYQTVNGFLPDAVIVDYLDLMGSARGISAENMFIKDKYVSEELRAIADEFNLLMVSAAQLGKHHQSTTDYKQGDVQGGSSKVNTTDNLIALIQTESMKLAGDFVFKYLKTRNSGGVGKSTLLKMNSKILRITNSDGTDPLDKYSEEELKLQPLLESDLLSMMENL